MVQDNEGYWYVILDRKKDEWSQWLTDGDEDEVPDFAHPVGGHPSLVRFKVVA